MCDKCDNCGAELNSDDYFGEYESRGQFWGAPVLNGYLDRDHTIREKTHVQMRKLILSFGKSTITWT